MKVGILLPKSGEYPHIAIELLESLRLSAGRNINDNTLSFVSENIGFGESEKAVYNSAEKLLVTEGVDLLIAYIDMKVISLLEPLIFATGKLLVVLNTGANYPENKIPQKGIIYLTHQHSFLCSLTGTAVGERSPAIFATTFYDCGYLHGAAMVGGFEKTGGQVVFNYINNCKQNEVFHIEELIAFLDTQENKTLSVLCIFDEAPANLFYRKLNEYEHADRLSLFVSPMMLTEKALGDGGYRFPISGYSLALTQNPSEDNIPFLNLRREKKTTNVFSLSGYTAGLLLNGIMQLPEPVRTNSDAIMEYAQTLTLETPAGRLNFDPKTNFFITDTVAHCHMNAGETILKISPEKTTKEAWDHFVETQPVGLSSGWVNTYLCY